MIKKNRIYFDPKNFSFKYPILENGLGVDDINEGIKVLKSGFITMNKHTSEFEKRFAKKINAKYAVMVNSGSSANLLATYASCNPLRKNRFKRGDEVLIPVLCWSTSLWPLVQAGLKPVFVDADPKTLNVNADTLISKITNKTKVIMLINVLGISTDLKKIKTIAKKRNIIIIEDNCEALGGKYENKYLGTFGDFGTFSFFYSHQITSGEGGMIVCKTENDYELLLSLRAHGWSRSKRSYILNAKKYPKLDPRYIFINSGFNVRPTDIQAAIGKSQFKKLDLFIKNRSINKKRIIKIIKNDKRWKNQFNFIDVPKKNEASYMNFPILINKDYKKIKKKFINYIENKGLETRPIISGSFVNQPATKLYKLNTKNFRYKGAQEIEDLGFVIGLNSKITNISKINYIIDTLFSIDDF